MFLSFTGAAATITAAYGLGRTVTRRSVNFATSLAVGSALLSLLVFGLMATHTARLPARIGLLVVCTIGTFVPLPVRMPRFDIPWWATAILVPFAVYALVNAFAPEIEADPNIYHLQPAIDAQTYHGFSRVVGFYERLPHATELLYVLSGKAGARLLHLSLLGATLPVIVALGLRFGLTRNAAWAGAVLYGISPVVLVAASSAFNDAALVFATLTSISVLVSGGPVWIAGLIAGFCFGIKMTGGITIVAGLVWLAWHRRWREFILFGTVAAIPMAPWLLRNAFQIHNPLAPFANRLFPNPLFHISTEQTLGEALRSYGIGFWRRFPEILWGWRLHGIIGPAFLVLPIVFCRRRPWLLVFAAILSIPWWMNAGTRFLTPALPFLALALTAALPVRVLPVVLAAHAITCWPEVIELYSPKTWHLHRFPIRAALGLESAHDYLWRTNWDYHFAKLVQDNTPNNARILDLHGIHRAHINRDVIGWWHSAWSENALRTLEFAREPGEAKLFETRASFPKQMIRGIRVRPAQAAAGPWSIVEIEVRNGRDAIVSNQKWALSAKPNRWETPFAFDRNFATRWQSWQPTEPRQWLAVDFTDPVEADTVRLISTRWDSGNTTFDIDIQQPNGTWKAAATRVEDHGSLNLRPSAMRYVKHLGFTHIVGRAGSDGIELLSHALADKAPEWNLEVLAEENAFYVLKLR